MRELKLYNLNQEYHKSQLRFAEDYRLWQTIDRRNQHNFDWRDLLRPFNRSYR